MSLSRRLNRQEQLTEAKRTKLAKQWELQRAKNLLAREFAPKLDGAIRDYDLSDAVSYGMLFPGRRKRNAASRT